MTTPQDGNKTLLYGGGIALALGSLFATWAAVNSPVHQALAESKFMDGLPSGIFGNVKARVSGLDLTTSLGFVSVPIWLIALAVCSAFVCLLLNQHKAAAVPRICILALLVIPMVVASIAVISILIHGTLGIGAFLLLAAGGIGIHSAYAAN